MQRSREDRASAISRRHDRSEADCWRPVILEDVVGTRPNARARRMLPTAVPSSSPHKLDGDFQADRRTQRRGRVLLRDRSAWIRYLLITSLPSTMYSLLPDRKMTAPSPTSRALNLPTCADVSPFAPALAILKLFRSTTIASLFPS